MNITGSFGVHNDTMTAVPVLIQPVVFSRGFSRISPSDNDVCVGASVGLVLALSCSWHAATGTVRMHLPAGIVTYYGSETTHCYPKTCCRGPSPDANRLRNSSKIFQLLCGNFLREINSRFCILKTRFFGFLTPVFPQMFNNRTFRSQNESSWITITRQVFTFCRVIFVCFRCNKSHLCVEYYSILLWTGLLPAS